MTLFSSRVVTWIVLLAMRKTVTTFTRLLNSSFARDAIKVVAMRAVTDQVPRGSFYLM